jgi:CelD/BcsL family acetyltransferase involved in cellulose biosynthesis
VALRKAAEDKLRAYLLFLRGQPVAYLYCPVENGVLIYDRLGYDPKYASASPGTVLQLLALQALFEEKTHRLFDFTEGEGDHKEFFSTGSQRCADIFIFDRRARLLLVVLAHWMLSQITTGLGHLAARFGVRSKIRRLLRV